MKDSKEIFMQIVYKDMANIGKWMELQCKVFGKIQNSLNFCQNDKL